jgi:hypothetical protein
LRLQILQVVNFQRAVCFAGLREIDLIAKTQKLKLRLGSLYEDFVLPKLGVSEFVTLTSLLGVLF